RLTWTDPEMLFKLVQERVAASQGEDSTGESLWSQFFCPQVRGIDTKYFLASVVMPRPRDFLYLAKVAVATAVNRGHSQVGEDDVLDACKDYSSFAAEILRIEDNSQDGILEQVVYEF